MRDRCTVRGDAGSMLIETALSFVLMMSFVLGIIECCMMAYTYSVYSDAARQAVRYAPFHGADSSNCSGPSAGCGDQAGANVVNYATSYAQPFRALITGMTVAVAYPDGSSAAPSRVSVTIQYSYKPLFGLPGMTPVFQTSSVGRILY